MTVAQENTHTGFDPVAYVQHQLDESLFWNAGWDALNRLLNTHQSVTHQQMRRMVALVLVAAEAEGEREDAEHSMEDVLAFYGWSLRELTMTPAERDRAARTTTGTEVEVVNATGLRPRESTVTARALHRYRLRRFARMQRPMTHRCATHGRTRSRTRVRTASRTGTGGDADSGGDPDPAPHRVERPRLGMTLHSTPHHISHHRCLAAAGPNPLGEHRD